MDKKVPFNTTISKKLLKEFKFLAVKLEKRLNELHEEALKDILEKYSKSKP